MANKKQNSKKNSKVSSIDVKNKQNTKTVRDKSKKLSKNSKYTYKNFFKSEKQLDTITHETDPTVVLTAYQRLIYVYASNHVREGVELEDLMAEAQAGICEAIEDYNNPNTPKRRYTFNQACLYKIREAVYQYCLRNASQIKTPYYIQRGCMHVGQIFKLMQNQKVAEAILKRPGPADEQEIIQFIYNEKERLPLKPKKFIKEQINKKVNKEEFEQIYSGIVSHQLGSKHSYVKNNLTDIGKILHIKEKIWYSADSNNMKYSRVIDLVLAARQSQISLDPTMYGYGGERTEKKVFTREIFDYGKKICGEKEFSILISNKCYDMNYEEISKKFSIKKNTVTDVIKGCIRILRKDPLFQDWFNDLE